MRNAAAKGGWGAASAASRKFFCSPAQHMNHQRIIHLRITRKANAICTEEAFVGMELFPEVGHALKCGNYMKKDGDLFKGTTP